MVFPLFVMALLWDRFHLGGRRFLQARPVRIRLAGKVLATNTINIAVAAAFAVMGGFVIYLANTGQMTGGPGFQVSIGQGLSKAFARIETWTDPVPEPVLGLAVLALAAVFVITTLRDRHRPDGSTGGQTDEQPGCHSPTAGAHPEHHR
jgi:cytochrome c-type biogenesis protein